MLDSQKSASVRNAGKYRGHSVAFALQRYTPEEARAIEAWYAGKWSAERKAANAAKVRRDNLSEEARAAVSLANQVRATQIRRERWCDIIGFLVKAGHSSAREIADALDISRSSVNDYLKNLKDSGDVIVSGENQTTRYAASDAAAAQLPAMRALNGRLAKTDATQAEIVRIVAERGDASTREIAAEMKMTPQNIGKQAGRLVDAGKLDRFNAGTSHRYRVTS